MFWRRRPPQSIEAALDQHGLARLHGTMRAAAQEALSLKTRRLKEQQVPIGASKIGGQPDLPASAAWPVWHAEPLAFVAQINLAELPREIFLSVLPADGLLSFFYCAKQVTAGFDPNDYGSWRVLYHPTDRLARRAFPSDLPKPARYRSCGVSYQTTLTVPSRDSLYSVDFALTGEEHKRYLDFWLEYLSAGHQLLGHPDEIQGEMKLECQLVTNGFYLDAKAYQDPRVEVLRPGVRDWQLLLQVGSDDKAGMMWGDLGQLYFWITRADLARRNFDGVWMMLQCS